MEYIRSTNTTSIIAGREGSSILDRPSEFLTLRVSKSNFNLVRNIVTTIRRALQDDITAKSFLRRLKRKGERKKKREER